MTIIPTGVSGKSTNGIGRNRSGSAAATRSPGHGNSRNPNHTLLTIPANWSEAGRENEARQVRNKLREVRRSAPGPGQVEADKPMLLIEDFPKLPPTGPTLGNLMPESSKMTTLFNNIRAMSPGQFVKMMHIAPSFLGSLIQSTPPIPSTDIPNAQAHTHNKVLFTEEDEKPRDLMGRKYEIPDAIYDLFACNVHVPLMMTTSEMIERFHTDPSAAKTKTMVDIVGGDAS
jgi:hypothetical protein